MGVDSDKPLATGEKVIQRAEGVLRDASSGTWRAVLLCIGVGTGLSVLAYVTTVRLQDRAVESEFGRAAENRVTAIEREIEWAGFTLRALEAQHMTRGRIDGAQFSAFVSRLEAQQRKVRAIEWVPSVRGGEREGFEREMRRSGIEGFEIRERSAGGELTRAGERDLYYPITFVEPAKQNQGAVGLDVRLNSGRNPTEVARDTGTVQTTTRATLVQDQAPDLSVVLFMPVYRQGGGRGSVEERRRNHVGYYAAVVSVRDLVEQALSYLKPQGVDVSVEDEDAPAEWRFLYRHQSRLRTKQVNSPTVPQHLHYARQISVPGRRWLVSCSVAPGFYTERLGSERALVVLILGLLTTFTAAAYFRRGVRRANELEQLVAERTRALWEANKALEEELTVREESRRLLAEAHQHALQASTLKSQLLANVSHEIRTPMNGILGTADLLLQTSLSELQREYVSILRDSSRSLLALLNDLLDLSRAESGTMKLDRVSFELAPLVEGVVQTLAAWARQKDLDVAYYLPSNLCGTFLGDPTRIRQMLLNLLSNAVKFTSTGGVLIEVGAMAGTGLLRFTVRDTGIGIGAEDLGVLFKRFSQVDPSPTRRFGGAGLGLALCREFAQLMGGSVGVESEVGKGSTFWFEINLPEEQQGGRETVSAGSVYVEIAEPVSREAVERYLLDWGLKLAGDALEAGICIRNRTGSAPLTGWDIRGAHRCRLSWPAQRKELLAALSGDRPGAQTPIQSRPEAMRPLSILIAEDNAVNRHIVVHMVQQLGHKPVAVENGRQAVQAFRAGTFNLVLMDCQMPEMDGFEATAEIRRISPRYIPILALTASAMREDRERCLAAEMDEVLTKPIELRRLDQALRSWAARAASPEWASKMEPGEPSAPTSESWPAN